MGVKLKQVAIAIDQFINTILGGWADETLSSRVWRLSLRRAGMWELLRRLIDAMFFWENDHCEASYRSEQRRHQLPPEFRDHPIFTHR
jgi:hypothetical protein